MRVLDALRKQRNVSDYDGEPVSDAALQACLIQAKSLLARLQEALKDRPEFRRKDA